MSLASVVTTIQPPTDCLRRLAADLCGRGAKLYVVGDRKGPASFHLPGATFYSLATQHGLPFALARSLPVGHYTRKNLGYLLAICEGATCIYETDDDNRPNDSWRPREVVTSARVLSPRPWANVYRLFSDELIWPRGFPLDRITDPATFAGDFAEEETAVRAPIQQGLADVAPDVDAVWRLIFGHDVHFRRGPSVALPAGTWCPFNSQTTWWWPEAFPLLYLPSHCSFRMTDIWRSFVAQRCLWELGCPLVFHAAEAVQDRNDHRLIRDFQDEVSGYLQNDAIVRELDGLELDSGPEAVAANLMRCYERLVACRFIPRDELDLVRAWCDDLAVLGDGLADLGEDRREAG